MHAFEGFRMTARYRPWGAADRVLDSISGMGDGASHEDLEHKTARRCSLAIVALRAFRARLTRLITFLAAVCCLVYIIYTFIVGGEAARLQWEKDRHAQLSSWYSPVCGVWVVNGSPPYREYAMRNHEPLSQGPLAIPYQRPIQECRTFRSDQVERVIADVTKRMVDKDLARLFENCFPNTLDTTVRWHSPDPKNPQSFIITGDIDAEWLRDSTNQLAPYASLIAMDKHLALLFRGAITTQAEFVSKAAYCNAFQPPLDSHIPPVLDHDKDKVYPPYDPTDVFECKYELDSLASFLKLSWLYYDRMDDVSFVTSTWLKAISLVMKVIEQQMEPSFDPTTGEAKYARYTFQRLTTLGSETLPLAGVGNPVNENTSLVRSAFRPSDDATILPFLIPANAFMSVELEHLSIILQDRRVHTPSSMDSIAIIAEKARVISRGIANGIHENAVFKHPIFSDVYAYEVDGYGGRIFMDDANLPSLLSLPLLGFVDRKDPVYQATRKMVLSSLGNPYYLTGHQFEGIGGPHIGIRHAWPMSLLVQIMTSDDDVEIMKLLGLLKSSTGGLGLMHESVNVRRVVDYTRPWFAWANGLFGEMILDLIARKPDLILEKEFKHHRD